MVDVAEDFAQAIEALTGYRPKETVLPGQMCRFSTSPKASDKAGWCKLFLDGRAGVYGDHRTGLSGVWAAKSTKPPTLAQRQQNATELRLARDDAAATQAVHWAIAASRNAELWAQGVPITVGDPVAQYLESRGIHLDSWPEALRYHSVLDYWHDGRLMGRHPAMLGAVTDATGKLVSVHRTYLTKDGRKADLPIVKKLTGCSARLAGCSIKLYQPARIQGLEYIGVAEGIETALACFAASGTPTVSAISAQGMERYQWPEGVKNLIIYADNDLSQVGQRAADGLARRASKAELPVRVLTPPHAGTDWADVWGVYEEGQ
jgi:putative DNA primase/helicase